jgi:hypothetical protein
LQVQAVAAAEADLLQCFGDGGVAAEHAQLPRAEVPAGGLKPVEVLVVGEPDRGAQHGHELVKSAGAMDRQPTGAPRAPGEVIQRHAETQPAGA